MAQVGVRELKAHLGDYLARAEAGERIVVTRYGKEIAQITAPSVERKVLAAMVAEDRARHGGGKPAGARGVAVRGRPVSDTVLEDRR